MGHLKKNNCQSVKDKHVFLLPSGTCCAVKGCDGLHSVKKGWVFYSEGAKSLSPSSCAGCSCRRRSCWWTRCRSRSGSTAGREPSPKPDITPGQASCKPIETDQEGNWLWQCWQQQLIYSLQHGSICGLWSNLLYQSSVCERGPHVLVLKYEDMKEVHARFKPGTAVCCFQALTEYHSPGGVLPFLGLLASCAMCHHHHRHHYHRDHHHCIVTTLLGKSLPSPRPRPVLSQLSDKIMWIMINIYTFITTTTTLIIKVRLQIYPHLADFPELFFLALSWNTNEHKWKSARWG